MKSLPKVTGLRSFRELAHFVGKSKLSLSRILMRIHAKDREDGGGDWLVLVGHKYLVNVSRLRRAHPALFDVRLVDQDDFEEHDERLAELEAVVKKSESRIKIVADSLRVAVETDALKKRIRA